MEDNELKFKTMALEVFKDGDMVNTMWNINVGMRSTCREYESLHNLHEKISIAAKVVGYGLEMYRKGYIDGLKDMKEAGSEALHQALAADTVDC